jgi:hypothetical protein
MIYSLSMVASGELTGEAAFHLGRTINFAAKGWHPI